MSERSWRLYVDDMLVFSRKVQDYTANLDQTAFETKSIVFDATLRNLELIGEAATHVPDEIRSSFPNIPWRMIIATRNQLIHAYLGIDNDTVWSIIEDDLPELIQNLMLILESQLS